MRILTCSLVLLAAASALAPPASAADTTCDPAAPCLVVSVDATGFLDTTMWNVTVGDQHTLLVYNEDSVTHTVTIPSLGVSVTAPANDADGVVSAPFSASQAGSFQVKDSPSGATATLVAVTCDVVNYENGITESCTATATATGKTPGLEAAAVAAALVVLAALRRKA